MEEEFFHWEVRLEQDLKHLNQDHGVVPRGERGGVDPSVGGERGRGECGD